MTMFDDEFWSSNADAAVESTDDIAPDRYPASEGPAGTTGTRTKADAPHLGLTPSNPDTIRLANDRFADMVDGFEAPLDNGDGTYTGYDQLDVSNLTSDGGTTPVTAADVWVTDDGAGNAVLNFPGGETLVFVNVSPADINDQAALIAMGIPVAAGSDGYCHAADCASHGDVQNFFQSDVEPNSIDQATLPEPPETGTGPALAALRSGECTAAEKPIVPIMINDGPEKEPDDMFEDCVTENLFVLTNLSADHPKSGGFNARPEMRYDDIIVHADDVCAGSSRQWDGQATTAHQLENLICFTLGTRILTPYGERAIETLKAGDKLVTRDNGLRPIRWIGRRTVTGRGVLAPIEITPDEPADGRAALRISPLHRMLFTGYRAQMLFGQSEVLVAAKHLINGADIRQAPCDEVTYIHVMLDAHEIIFAEGTATESFYAGTQGIDAVTEGAREEMFSLFPELRSNPGAHGRTARICLQPHEVQLLS